MAKLYLYFKKNSDTTVMNTLKVKLDNTKTAEVQKQEIWEVELENGTHNIKMYAEGWNKEDTVGYIDQDITINENCYLVYKPPMMITGKGKLKQKNYKDPETFKKNMMKNKKIVHIIGIILIILAIIISVFID